MKKEDNYDLILNHITAGESMPPFRENFEEYKRMAHLYLNHKGRSMFEDEILSKYHEGKTMAELLESSLEQYIPGANKERNGKREKTWYDIWSMEEIEASDDFFDYFFTVKLRHIDLLEIDDYLNYHQEHSFKNARSNFFRFLRLAVRKYEKKLLTPQIIETILEWISTAEASPEISGLEKTGNVKGRIQREQGDRLTSLSLVQTALLIEYLQQARIILKGDNLTNTQAGKAFNILTGYSSNTIRLQLGTKGIVQEAKHEDYKELHQAILELAKLIEPKVR